MITCIGKLKDRSVIEASEDSEPLSPQYTLAEVAAEVKATLGKGGNPDALVIEDYIGYPITVDNPEAGMLPELKRPPPAPRKARPQAKQGSGENRSRRSSNQGGRNRSGKGKSSGQ